MHRALLIDEILRDIFEFCLESGRGTLVQVARSCKSWKDPALDKIWRRLSWVGPLLDLIPGLSYIEGVYVSPPHYNRL